MSEDSVSVTPPKTPPAEFLPPANLPPEGLDFLSQGSDTADTDLVYRKNDGSLETLSPKEAARWFKEAESGKPQAQYNVGMVYFKGQLRK